jgi:PPOX class probable F420-dependent enzyme
VILDPATVKGAHALERLGSAMAGWLTTVTADGQPQSMPVWFLWTGGEIIIYGDHRAKRNANLAANPKVSFHLPDEGGGNDVVTFEATARIDPSYAAANENAAYLAKYGRRVDAAVEMPSDGAAKFAEIYSVRIRLSPTRAVVYPG